MGGHKIRFSLGAWFSCKDRQEGLFFRLVVRYWIRG